MVKSALRLKNPVPFSIDQISATVISFIMVECAIESPMHGLSVAHSTGVTSVFPKKLWGILSRLHLTQKLASVRKYRKISFDIENSSPFSIDQVSTTKISFTMVECAIVFFLLLKIHHFFCKSACKVFQKHSKVTGKLKECSGD